MDAGTSAIDALVVNMTQGLADGWPHENFAGIITRVIVPTTGCTSRETQPRVGLHALALADPAVQS